MSANVFPWRRAAAMIATLGLVLAACTSDSSPGASGGGGGGGDTLVFLSTQLAPVEEAEKLRAEILADYEGEVEFIGSEAGPFTDRVRAQQESGSGDVSLLGGLHGDFAAFEADTFMDLSDVASDLADLGINEQFLELGKLGGDTQIYIPWMQATYIMAANRDALEYLPDGADLNALTWEQLTEWGANITEATGERRLGFPAGQDGLLHRFFQGYAYPSFTGALNTAFASDGAVEMWTWLTDTWQYVNPQSTTYGFMQDPLRSGEVWVAWDHTARLIDALRSDPEQYVAFPVPAGPEGRGYMPVVAGLAVPATAADPDGAKELIRYLLQPETQAATLQQVAFFPVIEEELPGELEPGIQAEQEAVQALSTADDALPSLLPVGLGEQGGAYSQVFKDAFQQIVVDGGDPAEVLGNLSGTLQGVLDAVEAACWEPDPPSDGTCQVQ